jgi:hypothetical protein
MIETDSNSRICQGTFAAEIAYYRTTNGTYIVVSAILTVVALAACRILAQESDARGSYGSVELRVRRGEHCPELRRLIPQLVMLVSN